MPCTLDHIPPRPRPRLLPLLPLLSAQFLFHLVFYDNLCLLRAEMGYNVSDESSKVRVKFVVSGKVVASKRLGILRYAFNNCVIYHLILFIYFF